MHRPKPKRITLCNILLKLDVSADHSLSRSGMVLLYAAKERIISDISKLFTRFLAFSSSKVEKMLIYRKKVAGITPLQPSGISIVRYRYLSWDVVYQPGRVEAIGYRGGKRVMTQRIETTGKAPELSRTFRCVGLPSRLPLRQFTIPTAPCAASEAANRTP